MDPKKMALIRKIKPDLDLTLESIPDEDAKKRFLDGLYRSLLPASDDLADMYLGPRRSHNVLFFVKRALGKIRRG
jgi:hypothetical protein